MKDPRSSSATPLALGALLLAVLPIATCAWCDGTGRPSAFYDKGLGNPPPCFICEGRGRVTPLTKWLNPPF